MQIPIPCKFGDNAKCQNRILPLEGVSWFQWTCGIEYTYFFTVNNMWHSVDFYTTFQDEQKYSIDIPNNLLVDGSLKNKGFPLKGTGYANGIYYKHGNLYIDFIITSNYMSHIRVQCDEHFACVKDGDIIFPPSWDTKEKREKALLKTTIKSVCDKKQDVNYEHEA